MTKKRTNWRSHLRRQRQMTTYFADIEAIRVETRLQRHFPAAWPTIQAKWQALPDLESCLPQQRRDFLLHQEAILDKEAPCHSPTA